MNRLLSEHKGETFTLFNSSDNFSRAAAKTEVKIVNGGMNCFAYNKEGINKLANRFGTAREMLRTHEYLEHSKAGTKINVTETRDITNRGINAYG